MHKVNLYLHIVKAMSIKYVFFCGHKSNQIFQALIHSQPLGLMLEFLFRVGYH